MRKLTIEIHSYSSKNLSPRYHISKESFTKIRQEKMNLFNGCCESCGKTDTKMELHESGRFTNTSYIFEGFYLLCQKCHDMVHCLNIASNHSGVTNQNIDWAWEKYEMPKYSLFKTKSKFTSHVWLCFDNVFGFMMNDKVDADYSKSKEYGLNPEILKNGFDKRYNHFSARIRFMAWYLHWQSANEKLREKHGILIERYYELFKEKEKVKMYTGILKAEHLKHKEFYESKWDILHTTKHPEREKVISEYADIMKLQSSKLMTC